MASLNITNIPAPRVPFIDERTGLMAREWYRFFLNLFVLTGSGNNPITLEELQLGPPSQPNLAELLIQINQNIAPQYEDQSGDFLATLDTAQLMSMMSRFENAEAAIQGAYLQPVVQTGTIANYNLDNSPTAGGIVYGTGPALAVSAAGTLGQVLTSAGAGTPTWAAAATGTVTSVAQSFTGGLISVAGSPITTSGTLALTVAGTSGGIPYFSSASTWATSAALAASALVVGGGAGAAPATITTGTGVTTALGVNTGTAGAFVVNGGALGTPSSGTVTNLTGTASININGTVGATTANTGAFTTITATGTVTASGATNGFVTDATNGLALFSGDPTNYNISRNSLDIQIKSASTIGALISGTRILDVSATGLSITGTLNTTGSISKNSTVIRGTLNIGRSNSSVTASATFYFSTRAFETTEAAGQIIIASATTIRNLYVSTSTAQGALGSCVLTARKNGVATSLTITIAAGAAAGIFSDTTNSVTFAAGDLISVQVVNNDAVNASAIFKTASVSQDIG